MNACTHEWHSEYINGDRAVAWLDWERSSLRVVVSGPFNSVRGCGIKVSYILDSRLLRVRCPKIDISSVLSLAPLVERIAEYGREVIRDGRGYETFLNMAARVVPLYIGRDGSLIEESSELWAPQPSSATS